MVSLTVVGVGVASCVLLALHRSRIPAGKRRWLGYLPNWNDFGGGR
jgi:hypothetical protein